MGVFLASYKGVWERHLYGLAKRVCVFLEAYIGVWKRLYMIVSKQLHMGASKQGKNIKNKKNKWAFC